MQDLELAVDSLDMMGTSENKAILVAKYNVSTCKEKTTPHIQEILNLVLDTHFFNVLNLCGCGQQLAYVSFLQIGRASELSQD